MKAATIATITAAVLLLQAGAAMAQITQPVTFNIFGKANRQPGTYTTATATIPEGAYSFALVDTMTDAEASDPANRFNLAIYVSPNGINWEAVYYGVWEGGTELNKFTGLPQAKHFRPTWSDERLQAGLMVGWLIRGELDQQTQMRVGFDVTVRPAPVQ